MPHPTHDLSIAPERIILIGLSTRDTDMDRVTEYLDELEFLAETAGGFTVKRFTQRLERPDIRTFVGKGKMEEIIAFIKENNIQIAIFDDELTPSQLRNIEKIIGCRVLDRTNLILDIFAKRARTAQAKVQVEDRKSVV